MFEILDNEHGLRHPRLKNYALHWLHRLGLRRFRLETRDLGCGVRISVRAGSHDEVIVREIWEEDMYPLEGIEFEPQDVVFDAGAQIGSFSLLAASRGARVIAFEPCPMNLRMLRHNIDQNDLQARIDVHGCALYRPGVDSLKLYQTYTNLGGHSLMSWIGPARQVRCVSLPEIFERLTITSCKLLKLDVEGAECPILYSAGSDLLARVEVIFAEIIDHPVIEQRRLPGEPPHDHFGVLEFLAAEGFSVDFNPTTHIVRGRR